MYQALYRKWRPMTFDDVVGQPHITSTLKNQIKNNKVAHAYLFTGSRGTGKTTCARIFAKTINCLNPKDGSPCLECEICKAADKGVLNDIIEIDAASNTGVDDIREIRESAAFLPEICKYKVYIIDEVHMITPNAFNAFLKILEEPPAHVKFIFATTEDHKVLPTITSRCQGFKFNRIQTNDIVERLMYIANRENIQLDTNAASLIAKLSDGGMRDALSLLDQCAAFSGDIDVETVSSAAGIANRDYLFELLECVRDNNPADAIAIVDKLYDMSKDMQQLCVELLTLIRDMMLAKAVSGKDELLSCLPDEVSRLREISDKMDLETILSKLEIIKECNERLPRANSKRVEIEMCIVKLCSDVSRFIAPSKSSAVDNEAVKRLENRLYKLEEALANGAAIKSTPKTDEPLVPKQQAPITEPVVDTSKITPDMLQPVTDWSEIVDGLKESYPHVGGFLAKSTAFEYQNVFFIIVDNDFFLKLFKESDAAKIIQEELKNHNGKTYAIRVKSAKNVSPDDSENPINKLIQRAKEADIVVDIH